MQAHGAHAHTTSACLPWLPPPSMHMLVNTPVPHGPAAMHSQTFVDMVLLAEAKCLLHSKSGFAKAAQVGGSCICSDSLMCMHAHGLSGHCEVLNMSISISQLLRN